MKKPEFSGRGWLLSHEDRTRLLHLIPPAYGEVVAHHVTFAPAERPTPEIGRAEVVGVADDGEGVQALVVRIDGGAERPDGSTWHITWSLGAGRRPVESNAVIAERGWTPLPEPAPIRLKRWG
ncbi:MAG: hypothetical protein M3M95_03120 [Pseudomonadota bacterium]|nr:hypothetical protein [Pseudomonadota bacterium]